MRARPESERGTESCTAESSTAESSAIEVSAASSRATGSGDRARRKAEAQAGLERGARGHYLAGNRFFDRKEWPHALAEWRIAERLWQHASSGGAPVRRRWLHLRAALALLLTVAAVYTAVLLLAPRDPMDLIVMTGQVEDSRSWWERFLDTGRPQLGGASGHKMGIREWWERFRERRQGRGEQGLADGRGSTRPRVDERWEKLLRRYGRYGPFFNVQLDYHVIAGYGLSRLQEYDKAVAVFERGLAVGEDKLKRADLYQGLANAHYYKGYHLQPDGLAQYDLALVKKATRSYEESVRYQPRPVSLGNLGWMYYLLRDYEKSERYSREALSIDENLEYVRLNLGLLHLAQDQLYEAFDAYRDVLRRDPPQEVYLGGINDLREMMRDNPGRYPFAHLMVGLLSLKRADYTQARESLGRFQSSPYVGSQWRELSKRLLEQMAVEEAK